MEDVHELYLLCYDVMMRLPCLDNYTDIANLEKWEFNPSTGMLFSFLFYLIRLMVCGILEISDRRISAEEKLLGGFATMSVHCNCRFHQDDNTCTIIHFHPPVMIIATII